MREEIRQALTEVPPLGMVRFVDDGILRFMTPLAAKCMRSNLARTYPGRDLTGIRFGKLTALARNRRSNNHWFWECRCDCGNTCLVMSYNLTNINTRSCGCIRRKSTQGTGRANRGQHLFRGRPGLNLTGRRFGMLEAIKRSDKKGKWLCQCDCGATALVPTHNLMDGSTKSCGCLRRETTRKTGRANAGRRKAKARKAAA